ncbi:aminopeptidase N [Candidatus Enterovibrio altilux]|uniref:Aminopeptidase N n=1 Tax=Candidatus Enterovibrio altilux TaxID=1927128 RepID=A0A291BBT7_9GAMM|nr:aminopeptidase N [Candidatus Enterovibrio luxaltus]ATF10415.1 Membrane alanine aminopeptidase N [Candidatus Enterovibrio luxaltus]
MTQQLQVKYRKDYNAPDFTITHINLDFNLQPTHTRVTARSRVKQMVDGADSMLLNGEGLTLKKLNINGKSWPHYFKTAEGLILFQLPQKFELLIETEINPDENTSLEGLYKSDGAYCTQCEAEGFRRITYSLDRPDVLTQFTTTITANKAAYPYLLSNGNKVSEGDAGNGRHWVKWKDPHAKPSYLFALVGGDFDLLEDTFTTRSGREITLEIFVDKGNLYRAKHAMESLKHSMKWDESRFGLEYDLDIYMIVAVDFFNMGAMENKGLNVFNSKFVLANPDTATDSDYLSILAVIGHEYFHNWTGNRVTCRDWFQLSLKEGLTVFREQEFSSDLGSRVVTRIGNVRIMRSLQFAEDCSPMSHPIRPDKIIEMNNFYTLTVYAKGSEVIRIMHTILGEKRFQKGMKLYFERHDSTAVTCEDFIKAMEDASGVNLSQFRLWYSQSGTPTLTIETEYDAHEKTLILNIAQMTPETRDQKDKQPLLIPFDIELYASDGCVIELQLHGKAIDNVLHVTGTKQQFVFDNVNEKPMISMLREFSAPVKLNYNYSDQELTFLMVHARNEFARWDAAQMLLAKHIKINIFHIQQGEDIVLKNDVLNAFRSILLNRDLDVALKAEIMTLPSENEISGWFDVVDVNAIHQVSEAIKCCFAKSFADEFSAIYHTLNESEYRIDYKAIGNRNLRNICLSYLALNNHGNELVSVHYNNSDNMTDSIAALAVANHAQLPCRESLMQAFSNKWTHDGLVMDKWFILQGCNPANNALENVKLQVQHVAFNLKNPNRTQSLVASFSTNNLIHFHATNGSGYKFLSDIIIQLNELNPQVASRLIDPLLQWKRFDHKRQHLMRVELERLSALNNLAKDLYEKINKALEA